MSIDAQLKEMGLVLPKATDPVGSYVATKISGNLLYISGQISIDADGNLIFCFFIFSSKFIFFSFFYFYRIILFSQSKSKLLP